jgi:hypothetical protein
MSTVFLSYRRSDSEDITGRIYEHLVSRFGRANLFKDVDSIPAGVDFREAIRKAVRSSSIMLAIIGTGWLNTEDDAGNQRLNDPNDFVRIELEAALEQRTPIIPVLVRGATMPSPDQLPHSLHDLAYRNATPVRSDPDFVSDITRLCRAIEDRLQGTSHPGDPSVKNFVEYIFVDQLRLQSYIEQLGLPQSVQGHPSGRLNSHRSIIIFSEYLEKNNLAVPYRPRNPFEKETQQKRFRVETMMARRAYIPLKATVSTYAGLYIWVSLDADDATTTEYYPPGALFLIEDYRGKTGYPELMSGYSSLLLLVASLGKTPAYKEFVGTIGAFRAESDAQRRFAEDPIGTLSTVGAQFGGERRIRAIYRVRASCIEMGRNEGSVVTIGYPIIIEEA